MINIQEIIPTEIVQTIGWTLLHSLWQGMVIAIILAIVLYVFRKKSSQLRYALSIGAMLLLVITVSLTYLVEYQSIIQVGQDLNLTHFNDEISEGLLLTPIENTQTWFTIFSDYFNQNMPLMVMVWMLGMLFMGLRMIGEITYVYHLKNYRTQPVSGAIQRQLETLLTQLNIRKEVRILESLKVQTPMVVGFLKPVILMPIGLVSGLSSQQIESILAHELAHIKRHDFVVNLLQSFVEVLLFFNPAVWWISACIRAEREHCCDDLAISVTGDKATFVKTLAQLEESRMSNQFALAFAKNRNGVLHRIRRILKKDTTVHGFSRGFWGSLILVMSFFFVAFSEGKMEAKELQIDPREQLEIEENNSDEISQNNEPEVGEEEVSQEETDRSSEETSYVRDAFELEKLAYTPLPKFIVEKAATPPFVVAKGEIFSQKSSFVFSDSIPEKDRELQLLDRRIKELMEHLADMENNIANMEEESLEDFKKVREAEIKAMREAAADLAREEALMEKEVLAGVKYEQEKRELHMKEAQNQLALAKERIAREREMNLARIEADHKHALNERLMDLDERRAEIEREKDEYSDQEYAKMIENIEQARAEIKTAIDQELAMNKEQWQHQMKVQELAIQHEKESMDLELKQMDLALQRQQMDFAEQKRHMEVAKLEIERELKQLEKVDVETLKKEIAEARARAREEMDMLKMELEILKKEKKRRVE